MKLYHYTSRTNLHAILKDGLKPGSEVKQGEQLGFVMMSGDKPDVKVGNVIHFEIEVDDSDHRLVPINRSWYEYYGSIPAWKLVSLANPPADVNALIELVQDHGTVSPEYQSAFDFVTIPKIYNSYKEISVEEFVFDFYSTDPPVFRIMVTKRHGFVGWRASAMFHKNDMVDTIECHGKSSDEALEKLLAHLASHYTKER